MSVDFNGNEVAMKDHVRIVSAERLSEKFTVKSIMEVEPLAVLTGQYPMGNVVFLEEDVAVFMPEMRDSEFVFSVQDLGGDTEYTIAMLAGLNFTFPTEVLEVVSDPLSGDQTEELELLLQGVTLKAGDVVRIKPLEEIKKTVLDSSTETEYHIPLGDSYIIMNTEITKEHMDKEMKAVLFMTDPEVIYVEFELDGKTVIEWFPLSVIEL